MDPLTGPGFSRTISHRLNPQLRRRGFVAGRGGLSWSRKSDNDTIDLRFRRHPNAVDPYQGGRFQVELERTANKLGPAFSGRARLDQLLTREELKRLLDVQNAIILSLPAPPAEHINTYPASLRSTYLDGFRPQGAYSPGDLWLRFHTSDDLVWWTDVIASMLDTILERASHLDPAMVYLGSDIDLDATPLRPVAKR